ncbi:MAG TPA: Bax inhibitor-1/YccA family protein [Polyangia bacterium]|nr:Bax inhibitor-1/YccA family protein [Polyangia bacterium]
MAWIGPNQNQSRAQAVPAGRVVTRSDEAARTFLQRVYVYMSLGLAVTGLIGLSVASSPAARQFVFGNPVVLIGVILAQLGLVFAFTPVARRASVGVTAAMFFGYAALSGVTFSVIFLRYTAGSIGSTFIITGGTFAALSAYGAVTKRDLSSIGSFCMMGLFGLIIASVVNIFLGSPMLYWLTTFAGVLVFTGLTAYDTAKLKEIGAQGEVGEAQTKSALHGALVLYLDFINLFLYLLRLLGRRR